MQESEEEEDGDMEGYFHEVSASHGIRVVDHLLFHGFYFVKVCDLPYRSYIVLEEEKRMSK